jgi:hypothetical protein
MPRDQAARQLEADLMAEEPEAAERQQGMIADLVKMPCWQLEYGGSPQAMALWVDHYGLSSALENFSQDKFTLFLYREFVRHEEAWQKIRTSHLLPLHRPPRVAGTATPAICAPFPERGKQLWYSLGRLIHHSMAGAGYAWESAHWERTRGLCTDRIVR